MFVHSLRCVLGRTVRLIVKSFVSLLVFLLIVISIDSWINPIPLNDTTIVHHDTQGGDDQRLIVFLTGIQSSGQQVSVDLVPLWQTFGDVDVVEYNRVNFDARDVTRSVVKASEGYSQLTLIGASLGGLLSYDIIAQLKYEQSPIKINLILVDAPTGVEDIVNATAAKAVSKIPFGPLSNWLFTRTVWWFSFNPSDPSELEPVINTAALDALHATAADWPLSSWRQQLSYIVEHAKLQADVLRDVSTVFLRSSMDTVVTKDAATHWPYVPRPLRVIDIRSMHIEFLGFPEAWREGFEMAFAYL